MLCGNVLPGMAHYIRLSCPSPQFLPTLATSWSVYFVQSLDHIGLPCVKNQTEVLTLVLSSLSTRLERDRAIFSNKRKKKIFMLCHANVNAAKHKPPPHMMSWSVNVLSML